MPTDDLSTGNLPTSKERKDHSFQFDLFVIGGGINGTAIAADAAGRGLKVGLCEASDLGQAAFSRCGKAFHGGIRHLERLKLYTLHKTLKERNILLKRAPHLINAIPFVVPCNENSRPRWALQSGLSLYDLLGNKQLRPHLSQCEIPKDPLSCLNKNKGDWLVYPECEIDDSRLVISNALSASENNANILPRTLCTNAESTGGLWLIELEDALTGEQQFVQATAIINATGAEVDKTSCKTLGRKSRCHTEFVKHNYIIVKKFYHGEYGYKLQQNKRQAITVSPLDEEHCVIGPLVESYENADNKDQHIDCEQKNVDLEPGEIQRLLDLVNNLLDKPLSPAEVISSYGNIRAIYKDPASPSGTAQDYVLDFNCPNGKNPLVSVIGGSLMTHRVLAEQAMELLSPYLPNLDKPWTASAYLPGGELPLDELSGQSIPNQTLSTSTINPIKSFHSYEEMSNSVNSLLNLLKEKYNHLPLELLQRLVRCYGSRSFNLLGNKLELRELGQHFGQHLYEAECEFLINHEWAGSADDIIWRRSKLGLQFTDAERDGLTDWFNQVYTHFPAVKHLSN